MLTDAIAARLATIRERLNADIQAGSPKKVAYQTKLAFCGGKLIRAVPLKLTPATTTKGAARNSPSTARNRTRPVAFTIV
jgi:hypothetical protein